ncbi:hypothetical protein [Halovivax gelatinilyticus]|uniref:hypothetical protein n=1 Tax=Halovivax gelatinilyticus TaxID=2961597 RepID=UPI0020CA6AB4|nr:hypothetical protein [Halovivax gelatinilyticus]
MHRRSLLATVGLTVVGTLAGCLESTPLSGDPEPPDDLVEETFESITPDESVPASDEPPTIAFVEDDSRVVIEGSLTYSSSSCGGVDPGETSYDAVDGTVTTSVAAYYDHPSGTDCTADEVTTGYRLTLAFDDGVPETVEMTEDGTMGTFDVTESP